MLITKESDFGVFIASEQARLGISNYEMAKKVGIRGSNLKHIIEGKNSPTMKTMLKILEVIGASMEIS